MMINSVTLLTRSRYIYTLSCLDFSNQSYDFNKLDMAFCHLCSLGHPLSIHIYIAMLQFHMHPIMHPVSDSNLFNAPGCAFLSENVHCFNPITSLEA